MSPPLLPHAHGMSSSQPQTHCTSTQWALLRHLHCVHFFPHVISCSGAMTVPFPEHICLEVRPPVTRSPTFPGHVPSPSYCLGSSKAADRPDLTLPAPALAVRLIPKSPPSAFPTVTPALKPCPHGDPGSEVRQ